MGKTYRDYERLEERHPNRSSIASNVARGMVLGGTGRGGPMRARREKRQSNQKNSWRAEEEEHDTSE